MTIALVATLAGIAVLILLSAFFSGSETALTAASHPRMHQLERKGNRRAGTVNRLRQRKERMIGAILLGNNLVNILASALATSVLISAVGETGVVYATIAMTLLVLIFGEILPKTFAFQNPDRVALLIAPVFRVLVAVLGPITDGFQIVVRGLLGLFRVYSREGEDRARALEELRGAIELHPGSGSSADQERAMLRSILDLNDVEVEMVMRHRKDVVALDADLPASEIVDQALGSPHTRIPLWRGNPDDVVGVLHVRELARAVRAHAGDLDSLEIDRITAKPWFVPETTTLLDQLQAFRRRHEHFALVVDEYGALMGIITLEDIIEEIVGEISDELDVVPIGVRRQRDGAYLIDGDVTVRDLNRRYHWELPDQEAATIAGLVIHEARIIPEIGQIFVFHGFRFEVVRRERNQLTQIRVSPTDAGAQETAPAQEAAPVG
ncbi:MAG: HlyC/CorC family transporter [Defluviicoccus sp.]|nr:HlyC/CorC family transporter [Defluviicoccus sp.]